MNIGEAGKRSGISPKMIRHYESIGLLNAARQENGYRVYSDSDVHRLVFIRHGRDAGFSMAQIKALLELWDNQSRASADVKAIAANHIAALKQRKAEIEAMIGTLETLSAACHGDERPDCPIIDSLAAEDDHRAMRHSRTHPFPLKRVGA
jgi:Cu(I)-responsive transcriptional regulator